VGADRDDLDARLAPRGLDQLAAAAGDVVAEQQRAQRAGADLAARAHALDVDRLAQAHDLALAGQRLDVPRHAVAAHDYRGDDPRQLRRRLEVVERGGRAEHLRRLRPAVRERVGHAGVLHERDVARLRQRPLADRHAHAA
jgi:hypothetical protein